MLALSRVTLPASWAVWPWSNVPVVGDDGEHAAHEGFGPGAGARQGADRMKGAGGRPGVPEGLLEPLGHGVRG